jgi:hypothetical protein
MGAQDIQTGDARFDEAFLIQGQPEERVRQVLTPDARRALLRLRALLPSLRVQHSALEASDEGVMSNDRLRRALDALEAAGAALDEAARPSLQ